MFFTDKVDTAFPEAAGRSRATWKDMKLGKSTLRTQGGYAISLLLLHLISFLHVCTKGSLDCFKQLVILTLSLILDPLVQSPFPRRVLGVVIGLLPNSAKQRGKLGGELLEQISCIGCILMHVLVFKTRESNKIS